MQNLKLNKKIKLVIAADGGAASGKTTAAKLISKKYGLASYMIIIFAIILINVNANSEHSAHYLAWMKLN